MAMPNTLSPAVEKGLAEAARQGIDTDQLVNEAIEEKLRQVMGLSEGAAPSPNLIGLLALEEIRKLQEGWPETSGDDTQRMLREARAGGMYGLPPVDE